MSIPLAFVTLQVVCLLILVSVSALHTQFPRTRALLTNRESSAEGKTPEKCGPCPLASKCSGEYKDQGCDGSGKIQGGIGNFLSWWPIKVYRPCPSYLAAGYQYRREGQTMDQVLFSEPSTKMKEKIDAMRATELSEKEAAEKRGEKEKEKKRVELSDAEKFLEDTFGN